MAYVNLFNYVKYWWDNIKDVYLPANYTSVDDFSSLETDVNGKQDALSQDQLNAVNSGVTESKVSQYDGYADGKVNVSDTITDAQIDALFSSGQQEQSGGQGE